MDNIDGIIVVNKEIKKKIIFFKKRIDHLSNLLYPSYSYWCIGYLINPNFTRKIIDSNFLQNIIPIDEYLHIVSVEKK